jgi:hypothetical protein
MMRFRLYSTIAVVGAILLLPVLARTQQPSTTPAQQAPTTSGAKTPPAAQDEQQLQEKTPETKIQPVLSGPYPVMSKAAEDRGRQIFQMFNHTETSQMWASLSEGLRKMSGKEERFVEINKKMRERMGPETTVVEENMVPYLYAPDTVYSRLSMFANIRVPIMSIITFNQRGQVDAFDIKPMHTIAEGQYAGYQDKVQLKLPFSGEWLVYHGGRNIFENPYAAADDVRFAMDFVYLKDNRLFSGPGGIGSKVEDYYCFGQPILAPADGTVIRAICGYDDVPPGKPNGDNADGNIVIISHGDGESSLFDHLKQNSCKVKVDDKVKQGDVIAECGNSGLGGIPHIHYRFQKGMGIGLPAQFVDYIADGKTVASSEPKRGQFVKNGTATASAPATSMPAATSGTAAQAKPSTPAGK